MAEAEDLKSSKCGFDPHRGHNEISACIGAGNTLTPSSHEQDV